MSDYTYDEPEPSSAGYESMRSGFITHRAQINYPKRTNNSSLNSSRSKRLVRARVARDYTPYFVFLIVTSAINIACVSYLIVSVETKIGQIISLAKPPRTCTSKEALENQDLNLINSKVDAILSAVTYTIPSQLQSNKQGMINRINMILVEVHHILKHNFVDLKVVMSHNRTINYSSGNKGSSKLDETIRKIHDLSYDLQTIKAPTLPSLPIKTRTVRELPPLAFPTIKGMSNQSTKTNNKKKTTTFHDILTSFRISRV
uniref:Transmembrane protein n=1 Tax=Gainesville rodent jeilong virus 1 TaxID=3163281 RepID=A0AAU7T2I8_9MONO